MRKFYKIFYHFRFTTQFGQYHFDFGPGLFEAFKPTQPKWNHSISQSLLSQPIISPNDTCLHVQYKGSFGSTVKLKQFNYLKIKSYIKKFYLAYQLKSFLGLQVQLLNFDLMR